VRLLVTGREGQVARSLAERAGTTDGFDLVFVGRPEFDLACARTIGPAIEAARPDLVISAAAYTAVDQAEDEPDLAFAVNAAGAGEVARAATAVGAPVIHLSTDYVFDGTLDRPYREDDRTGPQGVYGASKLAGEEAVAAANPCHLILRTAWVYSPFGRNFVKTMLRLAETCDEVSVVADQLGNPTSAMDIADAVLTVAGRLRAEASFNRWGVYHLAGRGQASWADFAEEIFRVSRALGGPAAAVRRIPTSAFPTKAKRPANSRLDTAALQEAFDFSMPNWHDSCRSVIRRLVEIRP
jgi:dTDP-4-dehydrorhamnose reductase